jgi:type I restriction enzyme S subunit
MKPGFKQTEVGVIPVDWEVKTLGSLTTLLTNGFVGTATTAYVEGDDGVLYIQGYNVQENGFNFHGIKRVSKAFHARNKKSCLQTGDLLTIQTGDIGVTTVVPPELAGANCHALIISRLRKQESVPGYYCQYFNSERGRVAFKEIETGTTMKHLNGGDMKRLFLPSPPVEQQRAIATALSDVDGLLGGLDRLIAKKRDLKQAAMQQLLTGQTRLPGFHAEWEVKRLGEICEIAMGRTPPRLNQAFWGHGYKWLSIADLQTKVVSDSKEEITALAASMMTIIPKGTLLMSFKLSLGRLCFAGCDLFTNEAICSFNKLQANAHFLYYALGRTDFSLYGKQAVKGYTLNKESLKSIEVTLPPLPEQTAIASVLTEMDAELAALEQRREKTHALKQAMMQELLTGKTRLV